MHQAVLADEVSFLCVGTADQRADAMTKGSINELQEKAMISWAMAATP